MYPHPPPTHRPTNHYWVLVLCVAAMLGLLFMTLRNAAGRFGTIAAQPAVVAPAPSTSPIRASAAAEPTVVPSAAAEAAPEPTATPPGGILDVDPKTLTESPGTYRSRLVRVRGTVFYTGKIDGGKTWIQIVDNNNVYVDGQVADALPPGVAKGVQVELTGIGAGLFTVTASNGKDYDQAYIDPVQSIEVVH